MSNHPDNPKPNSNAESTIIRGNRPGHKIRLTADSTSPQDVRLFLEDVEITDFTDFKLEIGVRKPNTATIRLFAGDIEIDANAKAILEGVQVGIREIVTPEK